MRRPVAQRGFGPAGAVLACALVLSSAPADAGRIHAPPSSALPDRVELAAAAVQPRKGLAWTARLTLDAAQGDVSAHPRRSAWILLEDDLPLGPAHARHADVESHGRGRYSHWNNSIIFSTSDNSDPRTNGRAYTLVRGVDEHGKRIHFDSPGSVMVLRRGEKMWWPGGEAFEMFRPRFGPRRPEVNPAAPRLDGPTIVFDTPGEYGLRTGGRALRLLVLDDDPAHHARQIVSFIAANTTGDNRDMPEKQGRAIESAVALSLYCDLLFHTDRPIDVECGPAALLAEVMAAAAGLEWRYCRWIGDDPAYSSHVAVEIFNPRSGSWEYFDPHFGLAARDRLDAATLALSLQGAYAGREDRAFTVLVEKAAPQDVATQFRSFREALQLWRERGRTTSAVLLLRDTIPPTLESALYDEVEFLSASRDLGRFRAMFYRPALADAGEGPER